MNGTEPPDLPEGVNPNRQLDRLQAELERTQSALRQFASRASHDLQAPLRHIRVFASLIKREEEDRLSDTGVEYLDRIEDAGARMQDLIEVLLEYVSVVNTPPQTQAVNLNGLLSDCVQDLASSLSAHQAQIRLSPLPDVHADPALMHQVFKELIVNALHHKAEKPPIITITGDQTGEEVRITVSDNGPGIAPKHADVAFELLRRLDTASDPVGRGVGLAFCKQIIESQGGRICLDTSQETGTHILMTLPLAGLD